MTPFDDLLRQMPAFKDSVPTWARTLTFGFFIFVLQCSTCIFLASTNEMMGETALMQDDIQYIGDALFVGFTIIFPMLFRLKFRFSTRVIMRIVTIGLIVCLLINQYTHSLPLLIVSSLVGGFLRMWGTFECFSSVQLRITPTRNFAVFFPVIYLSVYCCIQLSGLTAVHLNYFYSWHHMHYLAVGLLLVVLALSEMLLRPFHLGKPMPLYGIDGLGALLWVITAMTIVFVANYGEYFGWFESPYIRLGTLLAFVFAVISIGRMLHIRHPYIETALFTDYSKLWHVFGLFVALALISAFSTVLQGAFTVGILHFDSLNNISLNWAALAGVVAGALFSLYGMTHWHMKYKLLTFIGFTCETAYLVAFYFLLSPDTAIHQLYLPVAVKYFGHVIIYIVLTTYLQQIIPFKHFFQGLCVVGFIREAIGAPVAIAVVKHWYKKVTIANFEDLSAAIDAQHPLVRQLSVASVTAEVQRQATLVSIKQIMGYAVIIGLICLVCILLTRFKHIIRYARVPRVNSVRRLFAIKRVAEKPA